MTARLLTLIVLAAFLSGCAANSHKTMQTQAQQKKVPSTQPLVVVLVGDSTVTDSAGWGGGLAQLVGPNVKVINHAAGGRSSKSYRDEGKWDAALKDSGDYMLIQFGHNDIPGKGPTRETDARTTFVENMERYATEARAHGFKPILVTSLVRRKFQEDGKIKSDLTEYAQGTRKAAAETHTPLIELHDLSILYFDRLGKDECDRINPTDKRTHGPDATHLPEVWHKPVAQIVLTELKKIAPELAD